MSVGSAYFLRPNTATLNMFEKYRNEPTYGFDHTKDQCVSVYIRRGDKHAEMKFVEDIDMFFNAAKRAWEHMRIGSPSLPKDGTMFVASEDPSTMEKAIAWGKQHRWKVLYTNLFDRTKVTTWLNYTQQQELMRTGKQVHDELEYFAMVLNLDHHLKCSAFVGTLASNYCRVVEELKNTVALKSEKQYYEVHADTGITVY